MRASFSLVSRLVKKPGTGDGTELVALVSAIQLEAQGVAR